jgi:hypothetical protein
MVSPLDISRNYLYVCPLPEVTPMRTTPQENVRALLCRMRRRRTLLCPRLQVETISLETPIGRARMARVIIAVPEQPIPSKLPRSRPSFDILPTVRGGDVDLCSCWFAGG